jgi:spectinomycin phosphotransferase
LAHRGLEVPGRRALDDALATADEPWDAGPLSEPARRALREHLDVVRAWLAELTGVAERSAPTPRQVVVTHGEPHPGNVILTATGPRLIDWDTVALAPPERDLWMIADADRGAAAHYTRLTGTVLDEELLRAYGLLWAVMDVAAFTDQLHQPHRGGVDDQRALRGLRAILDDPDPRPFGPARAPS